VLPLRDINPTQRVPVVTYGLILINVAVFVYQFLVLDPVASRAFVEQHGVVPYFLTSGYARSLSTPITSMFLHGGVAHLLSNMWFLHVFGDNVEDLLGHARFVAFYLLTGIAAVLGHVLIDPTSTLPLVGASGAISGVLGAYVLMFPQARVVTFVPIFFLFEIPAFFFILVWFVMQVFSGFGSLATPQSPGVAFFAHIGGFVAGVVLLLAMGIPKRRRPIARLGPRISRRRMF
jgi:membrane associated rhomboid family serine protease